MKLGKMMMMKTKTKKKKFMINIELFIKNDNL